MLSRINRQLRPVLFSFYQSQSQLLNQYSSSTLSSSSSSSSKQCTAYDLTRYRSLIRIKGQDSAKYLQSLITNNIYNLNNEHVIYSMILNNRGRCMYDVLVYANEGINQQEFLIEFDSDYTNELMKFLNVYRIRKKVEISHVDNELKLYALVNFYRTNPVKADPNHLFLCSPDPRSIDLGHRVVISSPNESVSIKNYFNAQISTDITEYKKNLYKNGVAENQLDIPSNKSIPLEYNIALMNGVSFSKGCYLGQELIAKTHHTGVIRKRVMPIKLKNKTEKKFNRDAPIINLKSGKQAGKLINILGLYGIGMLRLADLEQDALALVDDLNENHLVSFHIPDYWNADENLIKLMKEKNLI